MWCVPGDLLLAVLKGIGGGSWVKMGFKLILIVPVVNFQELTELKKKSALLRYRTSKFGKIAKSYTFWGFWNFLFAIWEILLFLAPDQFQDPIFDQVIASYGFYKRYLGFFEIFIFWLFIASFWSKKPKKSQKSAIFDISDPQNGQKSQNHVCMYVCMYVCSLKRGRGIQMARFQL